MTDAPIGSDQWWREGANFQWKRPKLTIYKPSDLHPRALLNRYPHNVIGAGVVLFGRCFSLTWKGTR